MARTALFDSDLQDVDYHGTFVRRHCHPELLGLVDQIVGYSEEGHALRGHVEAASLVVPLVISFGDPFEIALGRAPTSDDRYTSFTSGLYPGHVLINSNGGAECIQIDFTPLGARRFFSLPMHEISGRMVKLEELDDGEIEALRSQLVEQRNWGKRLGLVEQFVRRRLRRNAVGSAAVAWAYERILRSQGDIRISRIAYALDWSRKHLVARFNKEVGVGPKAIARMVRLIGRLPSRRLHDVRIGRNSPSSAATPIRRIWCASFTNLLPRVPWPS